MLQKYIQQVESEEVKKWIKTVLKAYLSKNDENVGEIEHILDYFSFKRKKCKERNKRFKLTRLGYEQARDEASAWVEKQNKKAANIVETEADIVEIKELDNGLRLVKLVGENAFKREGRLMSHCVGSYYGKKGVEVYSIRDEGNSPHCTIEVSGDDANQVKGKGNGSIHPKYVGSVLKALKFLNKEVRKSEMTYLGYREVSKDIFAMYNKNFKGFKYINYKNSIFMYTNQKFERIV